MRANLLQGHWKGWPLKIGRPWNGKEPGRIFSRYLVQRNKLKNFNDGTLLTFLLVFYFMHTTPYHPHFLPTYCQSQQKMSYVRLCLSSTSLITISHHHWLNTVRLPTQVLIHAYSSQYCAGILKQSMGARNRVGIGFSYRPARLHSLAESVP